MAVLRAQLAGIGGDPAPPRKSAWLRRGDRTQAVHAMVPGCSLVLTLRDGRVYVGSVVRCLGESVLIALWGKRGPAAEIPSSEIRRAMIVPPHSWAEEHDVCRRQAAGLPAAINGGEETEP